MGWTSFFRRSGAPTSARTLARSFTVEGVRISFSVPLNEPTTEALFEVAHGSPPEDAFLAAYAAQLGQEGLCRIDALGITLPWQQVYALIRSPEHVGAMAELDLPPEIDLQPILDSENALSDANFELNIVGWVRDGLSTDISEIVGAVVMADGQSGMLTEAAWATADAVSRFSERPGIERSQHAQELAWGRIRPLASRARAFYRSPYLQTTVVLTPQTLRLPMSRQDVAGVRVLTVAPTFDDAPSDWLHAFDGLDDVHDHYDLTGSGGRIRVVLSEPVKRVLRVVKREMPGRRVAGARAERFMHNPWAYLGDTAQEVLQEDEFLDDKAAAGALTAAFSIAPRTENGRLQRVDLVVSQAFGDGSGRTNSKHFTTPAELHTFATKLEAALLDEREMFPWDEYDLTLDGDSARTLEEVRQIEFLWQAQPDARIAFDEIYGFEGYSKRIEGIGIAKPIYVPVFQKPSDDDEDKPGWLPQDLAPMVAVTLSGHEGQVLIPLTKEWVGEFDEQVAVAERGALASVTNAALPTPIETGQARALVDAFKSMLGAQDAVKTTQDTKEPKEKRIREVLLVKTNFHAVDYQEARREALAVREDQQPTVPRCLRPSVELKKHQRFGVAWFQHLVSRTPTDCRGALLADDMGLGKTLQLLCLLGSYYEQNPDAAPSLVLAPKSLLDNWRNEAQRFFTPSFPEVLVLYGEELNSRKQPLSLIDEQLQSRGVTDLLRPDWLGDSKLVITTYDVLTGYEFSLARQPFAFLICDEAQRIKTPGTQVTLAAKKLRAEFRVACTGTPVENSLADLWCLFDFIQPGLLGALEGFTQTYRRPIECDTPELLTALERLQQAIAPQTLRRTKKDIASELPRKLFAHSSSSGEPMQFVDLLDVSLRLEVDLSDHQVMLYKGGLKRLQDANDESDGRKRAKLSFAALHLMKAVCAEPYCIPGRKFLVDERGIDAHLLNSQKLAWLLEALSTVRDSGDKAIVFTELREVQNALAYFLRQSFGLKPFIVNGDSQNRQSYIDRFTDSPGFNVIILSTLAAGQGLNVTAANHVFHFTRAWNPAK